MARSWRNDTSQVYTLLAPSNVSVQQGMFTWGLNFD
jgi:hypothetical protein